MLFTERTHYWPFPTSVPQGTPLAHLERRIAAAAKDLGHTLPTATDFRKEVEIKNHRLEGPITEGVSQALSHSMQTADLYYQAPTVEDSFGAFTAIQAIIGTATPGPSSPLPSSHVSASMASSDRSGLSASTALSGPSGLSASTASPGPSGLLASTLPPSSNVANPPSTSATPPKRPSSLHESRLTKGAGRNPQTVCLSSLV